MPRELPKTDSGTEFIQFRGRQTSVTVEAPGLPAVHFGTEKRLGKVLHSAYPVADPEAEDPPDDAILAPVAEQLTETNPLVCYGVACPHVDANGQSCGKAFDTEKGMASHYGSVHSDGEGDTEDLENDQSDSATEEDGGA